SRPPRRPTATRPRPKPPPRPKATRSRPRAMPRRAPSPCPRRPTRFWTTPTMPRPGSRCRPSSPC
ncbi:MAG: hypothetical protein F9K34_15620, partial [Albidovulum sp.]